MKFAYATAMNDPLHFVELARAAEAYGFAAVAVSDHLAFPRLLESKYPYTDDGQPWWDQQTTPWPDPMVAIAMMAAATETLEFFTNIYVLPARHPVHVAKQLSTLSVMSRDRVALGVGMGWMREEFDLADQQFAARGRRADEAIAVIRKLAAGGWQQHHGEFYDFPETTMQPEPPAAPRILVGGTSQRALKRAAENDGWISERQSSEEILASLDWIGQRRRELGKADSPFESWVSPIDAFEPAAISALGKKGVTGILTMPWVLYEGREQVALDAKLSALERYAREVIQPVKGG
ncbi:MAG: TIGR03619 family F420-dependent LLM class oxidoreductase [Proteobacteria bacterium]|nr:TIGR03619 family F420-dependent LLM class oxidoreductase [Pseudomonadota bacterium]